MNELMTTTSGSLERLVELAVMGVGSVNTRRAYRKELRDFLVWLENSGMSISREAVLTYKDWLIDEDKSSATINRALSAVRSSVDNLAKHYGLDPATVLAVKSVKGVKKSGKRQNRWLSCEEVGRIKEGIDPESDRGKQEMVILALLLGCALRRDEAADLRWGNIKRQGEVMFLELEGKGNKTRQVPMAVWVQEALAAWREVAGGDDSEHVLQSVNLFNTGMVGSGGITAQAVYLIATDIAKRVGLGHVAPHNYRRTWAQQAYKRTGDINQIGLILGHTSIETTKKYLGLDAVDLERPLVVEF